MNVPTLSVIALTIAVHVYFRYRRKSLLPLPPGIPGWPIVGNAFSLPLSYGGLFFKNLGKRLDSKIMHFTALGRDIIVINDARIAQDLLEKRSGIYSSRPEMVMLADVARVNKIFGILPYGESWRIGRRLFQQFFSSKHMDQIREREVEFVRKCLLPGIYQSGGQAIHSNITNCLGGVALSLTYGLPVRREHDPLVTFSEKVADMVVRAGSPASYLVNFIPPLKYIPEWVPGAEFQRFGRELREQFVRLTDEPFNAALEKLRTSGTRESFTAYSIRKSLNRSDYETLSAHIKEAGPQVFGGASETTLAAIESFVLAMLLHPDSQRKAQQEIDEVVGFDRLPDFADLRQMPYLSAVIKEVMRWNPLVPLGVPHVVISDDVYEGYFIPKNSTIITNIYAMLHNDETFPDPDTFNPGRYFKEGALSSDLPDPEVFATFGFGRRICPGDQVARTMLYISTASILSLFDIGPVVKSDGTTEPVVPRFAGASVTSQPLPFKCVLTPRSTKDVASLLSDYLDADVI